MGKNSEKTKRLYTYMVFNDKEMYYFPSIEKVSYFLHDISIKNIENAIKYGTIIEGYTLDIMESYEK